MNKRFKLLAVSIGVIAILFFTGGFLFFYNNQDRVEGIQGSIKPGEIDPAVWGKYYPVHYDSYLENQKNPEKPSQFIERPYLQTLYAGTGFAAEYNEPRGHVYTLEDLRSIDPARLKTGAPCITCKTYQVNQLTQRYTDQFAAMSFAQVNGELKYPITCADCHNPETMALTITRPALKEALERQGRDVTKLSHQEMRSLVCAQCHVTYYFEPPNKKLTFPWDKGLTAENILTYYDEKKFSEVQHPAAGTGLVKPRHAEYETFMGSVHQTAGLSCADCHMPFTRVGGVKISSHHWTNPKENLEISCGSCHRQGVDWLKQQIDDVEKRTRQLQDVGGAAVVECINELAKSRQTPGYDQAKLQQAQEMHRKAQWYLDYVLVTNGWGFHNPRETYANLALAIDYAHKGTALAREARGSQAAPATAQVP